MAELMLNLSAWIERRADNLKPYADHIIHSVKAYEAEIERLRRPEAAQVRVKDLEWVPTKIDGEHLRDIAADMDGKLRYEVGVTPGNFYLLVSLPKGGLDSRGNYPSVEAAKAAAQADYENRIRAALEPDLLSTTGVDLGKRLQRTRIERGKSLRDLEDITGVSYSVIARIERGECDKPTPRVRSCLESWISGLDKAPDTVTGWQDISTAPKDGRIILWDYNKGLAVSGGWFGDLGRDTPEAYEPPSCGWASDDDLVEWEGVDNPTHWMPLPPAPEKEG